MDMLQTCKPANHKLASLSIYKLKFLVHKFYLNSYMTMQQKEQSRHKIYMHLPTDVYILLTGIFTLASYFEHIVFF